MRLLVLAVVCGLLLLPLAVRAAPVSPQSLQVLNSTSRDLTTQASASLGAQGGNVTQVNIFALSVTKTWQGYFGNITGNIRLDDANNNSFYVWGNGTLSGEVYATRNSTILWDTVNCTNSSERLTEETYLGVSPTDGDSVMNTFNATTHPSFLVGTQTVFTNTCFSTTARNATSQDTNDFYQVLLSDNASNIIYSTLIEDDTVGYDGTAMDFQLLVGENEHDGNGGSTTYYFFVELN